MYGHHTPFLGPHPYIIGSSSLVFFGSHIELRTRGFICVYIFIYYIYIVYIVLQHVSSACTPYVTVSAYESECVWLLVSLLHTYLVS